MTQCPIIISINNKTHINRWDTWVGHKLPILGFAFCVYKRLDFDLVFTGLDSTWLKVRDSTSHRDHLKIDIINIVCLLLSCAPQWGKTVEARSLSEYDIWSSKEYSIFYSRIMFLTQVEKEKWQWFRIQRDTSQRNPRSLLNYARFTCDQSFWCWSVHFTVWKVLTEKGINI